MKARNQKTKDLAEAIRNIMDDRGMTIKDFALLMGKDKRDVELWLSGMHRFNLKNLFHISEKLGLL